MKLGRRRRGPRLLAFAALAGITSCGGDGTTDPPPPPPPPPPAPVAPVAVGSMPASVLTVGQTETLNVAPFFSDPDGGALSYAAESSRQGVAAVSMSGSELTLAAVAAGTATVTVTATDPDGLSAVQSAGVTVEAANRAPEAVGRIPARALTAGQTATVNVAPFFSDPDGDELSYAAESSDDTVVAADVSGSELTLTAVAAGTATVTVTATDPDGLSAVQSAEVTVEAANRAPEAVGTIPAQTVTAGRTVEVDASAFFADPDGDELVYAAESTDTAVVAADMSGSRLTLTGVAAGTATVEVTATDPGGLSAAQSAEVTVGEPAGGGFREDFDSAASLDDWEISNADAAVAAGNLRLTPTTDDFIGIAERSLGATLTDWTIQARMGRTTSSGTVRLYWFTEDDRYHVFGVSLGPQGEHDYRFVFWDDAESGWFYAGDLSGVSDAVRDAPGEFTDVTVGLDGQTVYLTMGGVEIWKVMLRADLTHAIATVTDVWLAGTGNRQTVRFDRVHVTGTEEAAAMSAATKVARDPVLRAAGQAERRSDVTQNKR